MATHVQVDVSSAGTTLCNGTYDWVSHSVTMDGISVREFKKGTFCIRKTLKDSLKRVPEEALSSYVWGIFDGEGSLLYFNRVSTSVDNPPSSAWKVFDGAEPAPSLAIALMETTDVRGKSSLKERRSSYAESVRRRSLPGTTVGAMASRTVESKIAAGATSDCRTAAASASAASIMSATVTAAEISVIAAATNLPSAMYSDVATADAAGAATAAASTPDWQTSFDRLINVANEEQRAYLINNLQMRSIEHIS